MFGLVGAVVGTLAGIKTKEKEKKAKEKAIERMTRANIQSAEQLAAAGREAEADILRANQDAAVTAGMAAVEAEEALTPFADSNAFLQAQEEILSGLPVDDAFTQSIRQASTDFVRSRPEFNLSGPVGEELENQAGLTAQGMSPAMTQARLGAGQQGLAGVADVAQARRRGFQRLGDLAGSQAAQRAGVLIGQAPQLAQLSSGAREGRLLSDVVSQQYKTGVLEDLAGLAGTAFGTLMNRKPA